MMKRLSMLGIIGGAALLFAAPTTAVTSISRSMPDTARPLITRKVLAGIRTVTVRFPSTLRNIRLVANVGDINYYV